MSGLLVSLSSIESTGPRGFDLAWPVMPSTLALIPFDLVADSAVFFGDPLWARTTKNPDCSTRSLASPFAYLFACTAFSFACSALLARSTGLRSLAHFAHSLARGKVND